MRPPVATLASALTVADAMITDVKLTGADATVGDVRALFGNDHVHAAVIVERGILLAVLDRTDVVGRVEHLRAADLGYDASRVVRPDADLDAAREQLLVSGRRRLAVADADGTFRGLLCLKRTRRGFCSDRDVHARR